MFCRKCGKQFDGKYCPECGMPVQENNSEKSATPVNYPKKGLQAWAIAAISIVVFFAWLSFITKNIAISIFIISLLGIPTYLIIGIIMAVKKKKAASSFIAAGVCFIVMIVSAVMYASSVPSTFIAPPTSSSEKNKSSQKESMPSSSGASSDNAFVKGFKEGFNGSSNETKQSENSSSEVNETDTKAKSEAEDKTNEQKSSSSEELKETKEDFSFSKPSIKEDKEFGIITIVGEITNNTTSKCDFVSVTINFYDSNKNIIDSASAMVADLTAGQTKSFSIPHFGTMDNVSYQKMQVDYTI